MTPHLRRVAAVIWLIVVLCALALCAQRWREGDAVESDLLALLPRTERNPVAERAVAAASRLVGERSYFLVSASSFDAALAAARRAASELASEPGAFARLDLEVPALDFNAPAAVYAPHLPYLLRDEDARALAAAPAETLRARLAERLHAPLSFGPKTRLEDDPFGFLQRFMASLPWQNFKMSVRDRYLVAEEAGRVQLMFFGQPAGSPYEASVQNAATRAIARAQAALRDAPPGVEFAYTGALHYAAAARSQAESEMNRIGWVSLAGVLLLLAAVFRSARHVWVGLLPIASGLAVATAFCLLVYGKLHLLTLGCGATLIGVAVDYALLYFAAQLGAAERWKANEGLARVGPGLLLGAATTLIGYLLLCIAPFPGLRQMAVFSVAGLLAALLTVFLCLPLLLAQPLQRDAKQLLALPGALLARLGSLRAPRRVALLGALLFLGAAPGWSALRANDDIRLLNAPPEHLVAAEKMIRALAGVSGGGRLLLIEAPNDDTLREREARLLASLRVKPLADEIDGVWAVGNFLPAPAAQATSRAAMNAAVESGAVEAVLLDAGFTPAAVSRLLRNWRDAVPLAPEALLAAGFATPLRGLSLGAQEEGVARLVIPRGRASTQALRDALAGQPGVSVVDKAESISQLFARYRVIASWVLLAAFVLTALALSARYRWHGVLAVVGPAALAVLCTLSLLGWMGEALTLFHLLALFLVFGVGIDYTIFLREAEQGDAAIFFGVMLAAATTLLSFGSLAASANPALHGFGLTLFVGVLLSLLGAPLAMSRAATVARA